MTKTIVWDYNGTILDDAWLCLDIENRMLRQRGMKSGWTLEQYRDLFCFPVKDYYYKIGYTFENESYEDISVEFNDLYDEGFSQCHLIEGFMDKIREAQAKGYRSVIVSASRQDKLNAQIQALGIENFFDELIGIDDLLAHGKIQRALEWMKNSSTDAGECIYIGDSTHDKETADAMGIPVCWLVAQGHQSYNVLKKKEPVHTVHTLKEVQL